MVESEGGMEAQVGLGVGSVVEAKEGGGRAGREVAVTLGRLSSAPP